MMICIVLLMGCCCFISTEAANPRQDAAEDITSRSLYFDGMTDAVLSGHGYRNVTGISSIRCGSLCLSDTRCFSFNYSQREMFCELNGASATQFPQAMVARIGCRYYGHEKNISFLTKKRTQQACQEELDNDPPIFRSQERFPSADLTHAREHCAQCGMQLCFLPQLKAAYDTGYRNNQWGLIDIQGRDARSTPCDVYVDRPGECFYLNDEDSTRSAIPNTPRPAVSNSVYCCIPTL